MMRTRLPDHGTIVAYVALFVALGSGAYAAATIGSADIKRNAVKARHVAPGQIKARHVARGAVRAKQLAAGAVRADAIAPEQVERRHIAPGAVGPAELDPVAREGGGIMTAVADVQPLSPLQEVYVGFSGVDQPQSQEARVQTMTPDRDLVLRDFMLRWDSAATGPSIPDDLRLTLRIDGEDTGINCELTSALDDTCPSDTEVPVPAGSLLSMRVLPDPALPPSGTAPGTLRVAFALDPQ